MTADIVSYGALINVYSKAQHWEESLYLLKDALKQQLQLNSILFTSSIGSLGSQWRASLELILYMRSLMDLTSPAINSAMSCGVPWNCAVELLDRLGGLEISSHNAALVATMADWPSGLRLLQSMSFKRACAEGEPKYNEIPTELTMCEP